MSDTTTSRRGRGEDAIYFATAKNRYVGSVSLGFGPDGKRIRRKVFGKTKQEVVPAAALRRTPPATPAQRHELTLTTGDQVRDTGQWIKDLAAQHRTFAQRLAERQSLTIPSADPDYGDLGQAFPPWPAPAAGAILQPPKPEIPPSERIRDHITDRSADWEAAD